jgi:hypothetical protein
MAVDALFSGGIDSSRATIQSIHPISTVEKKAGKKFGQIDG